jgi:hypothetical protein
VEQAPEAVLDTPPNAALYDPDAELLTPHLIVEQYPPPGTIITLDVGAGLYPRAAHTLAPVKFKHMLPLVVTGEAQTFMFVATIPTEVTVPVHVV